MNRAQVRIIKFLALIIIVSFGYTLWVALQA